MPSALLMVLNIGCDFCSPERNMGRKKKPSDPKKQRFVTPKSINQRGTHNFILNPSPYGKVQKRHHFLETPLLWRHNLFHSKPP